MRFNRVQQLSLHSTRGARNAGTPDLREVRATRAARGGGGPDLRKVRATRAIQATKLKKARADHPTRAFSKSSSHCGGKGTARRDSYRATQKSPRDV